jgi:hypothetical protein
LDLRKGFGGLPAEAFVWSRKEMTGSNEIAPHDPYPRRVPLITWSGDMPIAVVFSQQQAAQAEAKISSVLFLCVGVPKSALLRSINECRRFFDEA